MIGGKKEIKERTNLDELCRIIVIDQVRVIINIHVSTQLVVIVSTATAESKQRGQTENLQIEVANGYSSTVKESDG